MQKKKYTSVLLYIYTQDNVLGYTLLTTFSIIRRLSVETWGTKHTGQRKKAQNVNKKDETPLPEGVPVVE